MTGLRPPASGKQGGFTLIELMIALVIGLVVTGAAIGIFLSSQNIYRSSEAMSRMQENMRTAYDLLARDLRVAGGNACNTRAVTNALTSGTGEWWGQLSDWGSAVKGYSTTTAFSSGGPAFGTSAGTRLSGTSAVDLFSGGDEVATVTADSGSVFTLNRSDANFVSSDVMVVCDTNRSMIFNATTVSGAAVTHPTTMTFAANAAVARFNAVRWYVGTNAAGNPALFRLREDGGTSAQEEVAEGVSALTMTYLVSGAASYVDASAVTSWSTVLSVRVAMTITSTAKVGTDGKALTRSMVNVISLRNRDG
ncbi:PilW family protein [Pseudoxanthomonas sp.]|uniref:PilW family protein n=1 Tax=Pseudoxanthomonas sp. TaxID=1871049 RepID=UPI00261BE9A6|nr:PilW family protein [Pseudoxanthomonas sp.]WDS37477.1 MAG: PilW family protein [Pseudoxanthomonas sp.]